MESMELVPVQRGLSAPAQIEALMQLSKTLAEATVVPMMFRGSYANVLAIMKTGGELGFPEMMSLRAVHIIKGVPGLSAAAKEALVLRSGLLAHRKEVASTDTVAEYEYCRKGETPIRRSFTIEDAKRARLTGDPESAWTKYPAKMLRWRCKVDILDDLFPDVLLGLGTYVDDIPGGLVDMNGQPLKDTIDLIPTGPHGGFKAPEVSPKAPPSAAVEPAAEPPRRGRKAAAKEERAPERPVEEVVQEIVDVEGVESAKSKAALFPDAAPIIEAAIAKAEAAEAAADDAERAEHQDPEPDTLRAFRAALASAHTQEALEKIKDRFLPWAKSEEGKPWGPSMGTIYAARKADITGSQVR